MIQRAKSALLGGIAAGLLVSVAFALNDVLANEYLDRGLSRLALEAIRHRQLEGLVFGLLGGLTFLILSELTARFPPGGHRASVAGSTAWRTILGLTIGLVGLIAYDTEFAKSQVRNTDLGIWLRGLEGPSELAAVALLLIAGAMLLWLVYRFLRTPRTSRRLRRVAAFFGRLAPSFAVLAVAAFLVVQVWLHLVERLRPASGPNIVLITIDTLRRDCLGIHGNDRNISPNIDRLGRRGVIFRKAVSQAPWTLPAMGSIFTSLYPSQHGANVVERGLGKQLTTVPEILRNAGYSTIGLTSHILIGRKYGFDQGFDHFDQSRSLWKADVTSELLTERALRYLGSGSDEPVFLWVHYLDPHHAYIGHPQFELARQRGRYSENYSIRQLEKRVDEIRPDEIRHVVDLYEEEVAFTDAAIGRLIEHVEDLPWTRPTVFLLTADHGEHMMERGRFGHGDDLYRQLLDVPLLVGGDIDEELRGHVVDSPVETRQIAPTVLDLARLEHDAIVGVGLLRIAKKRAREPTVSFAESTGAGGKIAAANQGWKLIRNLADGSEELYRIDEDPDELVSLVDSDSPVVAAKLAELREALAGFEAIDPASAPGRLELSEEELEHLRSLGYVQ